MPNWLLTLSWTAIAAGVASAIAVAADIASGHRQRMWIMNIVWPLTALYSGLAGLWAYYRVGRRSSSGSGGDGAGKRERHSSGDRPLAIASALGATHCGAGCCLGDLLAASIVIVAPITLFGLAMFGTWALDYVAAFAFGIAFQYFAIKPMRGLSVSQGLKAAVKADALSLTAWQVGMYGWMTIATFVIFGHELAKDGPVFWFMMQVAMLAGFSISWPVNAWLIRRGLKERM